MDVRDFTRIHCNIFKSNRFEVHQMNITKEQADKVTAALEINRVMARDENGNYTKEVTPKVITEAIAAMRSLREPEILHRMKYHPADPSEDLDWELFPLDTDECDECFEVLIVRASQDEALNIMRGLADAEPVALPGDLVIKALLAMDAEVRKRGEMYPQTLDEQREDTKSVRNVIASLEFYTSEKQCDNGWPSVKDWPALPATSPQAAQTEAQEREEFEAWSRQGSHGFDLSKASDGDYRNLATYGAFVGWLGRAGRKE